ncbi:hypothetical protein BpHYR1_030774 [Brachionus plicatilis]|uniref:Uncharacterized protein n=1 Tax=Brachionus plicatilis TaxID=10195 RepID=A0A3M7PIN1_BRAPC|nr:hypothetical protein BpHYR1_030774 [Brachionus plicatilis]
MTVLIVKKYHFFIIFCQNVDLLNMRYFMRYSSKISFSKFSFDFYETDISLAKYYVQYKK